MDLVLPVQAGALKVRERWVESKREAYKHSMDPGGVALPFQDQKMSRMQTQQQLWQLYFPPLHWLAQGFPPPYCCMTPTLKAQGDPQDMPGNAPHQPLQTQKHLEMSSIPV